MASINSVSSSSSIYGSRNVISGLASGMDTEAMIENAVAGIKAKITSLGQKKTKVEWQQEAYRSIISKMVSFTDKYTSYSSSTNLLSPSFFNNSVITTANSANADNAAKIFASGKTSNDVSILGVKQLATAARYTVSAAGLSGDSTKITGKDFTWGTQNFSAIDGTMTLKYGKNNTVSLRFNQEDTFEDAEALRNEIVKQLEDQTISFTGGATKKASECIDVVVDKDTGKITFNDKTTGGQEVTIGTTTGNFKEVFGSFEGGNVLTADSSKLTKEMTTAEYLADKSMTFTLDGVTKTIQFNDLLTNGKDTDITAFQTNLQAKLDQSFGADKIKVSRGGTVGSTGTMSFQVMNEGSSLKIASEANKILGLGEGDATTYLSTSKTLGDLSVLDGLDPVKMDSSKYTLKNETKDGLTTHYYLDDKGNKIITDADGNHLDANGDKVYSFKVNGVEVGQYSKNTALETVMLDLNNNTEAGVKVSYSKTTNEFVFTAKETGAGGRIDFAGSDGSALSRALFGGAGSAYTAGQDAVLTASINGTEMTLTRSSNQVELDGLNVTLNGTFGYKEQAVKGKGSITEIASGVYQDADGKAVNAEGQRLDADGNVMMETVRDTDAAAVTFSSKADADKIVDAIKSMVEDYNVMAKEIKDAYSTSPALKSNKTRYEPLTDEDLADMSETAIKAYEEKAKQGILFADSSLSSLYDKLRTAITSTGNDGSYLRSIGISTAYSSGLTTIEFDETKFRAALESDPDAVKDAFTKSQDSGSATNGLIANLKTTLDNYANRTGASKGILINKAGSPLAPTSVMSNDLQKILDNYDSQIGRWETKLSDQIDRYTTQFSRLEQLIAQMNNQSSMLSGLTGGSY